MEHLQHSRKRMVDGQIAARGIHDLRLLEAMRDVPREPFVPPELQTFAYNDAALPIDAGQTISQPYIVALMIAAAQLQPNDRVLEVGTGSGYAAAIMSRMAQRVYGIERHSVLADASKRTLRRLGYHNIVVRIGDGTSGWREEAPFDAILVAAAGPDVPDSLKDQLVVGGRLIMPIGEPHRPQALFKVVRIGKRTYETQNLGPVEFVPLIGEQGWSE